MKPTLVTRRQVLRWLSRVLAGVGVTELPTRHPHSFKSLGVDSLQLWPLAQSPVLNAREFGATGNGETDDRSAIQAALDAAEGGAGNGIVHLPNGVYAIGPEDGTVSRRAGELSLRIGDGVRLVLDARAVVVRRFRGGGAVNATIRNKNFAGGNRHIALLGGEIRTVNPRNVGKHLGFIRVTGFRLEKTRFTGVFGDWNASLHVNDAIITGVRMIRSGHDEGEDGVHLVGGQGVVLSDLKIESGDDCISLWPDADGNEGSIRDVAILGITAESAMANVLRVGLPPGSNHVVERVLVQDLRGKAGVNGSGNGLVIRDASGGGRVRQINVSNATIDCSANGGACAQLEGGGDITLADVRFLSPASRIEIDDCSDVRLLGVQVLRPRGGDVQCLLAGSRRPVVRLLLHKGTYDGATANGIHLGGEESSVSEFSMVGVQMKHARLSGLLLRNAIRGRIASCRATNNGRYGIEETLPSQANVFADNVLEGNLIGASRLSG